MADKHLDERHLTGRHLPKGIWLTGIWVDRHVSTRHFANDISGLKVFYVCVIYRHNCSQKGGHHGLTAELKKQMRITIRSWVRSLARSINMSLEKNGVRKIN
jgi:hypothetical protein